MGGVKGATPHFGQISSDNNTGLGVAGVMGVDARKLRCKDINCIVWQREAQVWPEARSKEFRIDVKKVSTRLKSNTIVQQRAPGKQ